ncbi:MAG: GIY-YIG nuclease family protein [Candidatus Binataceae bacterium]
MRESDAMRDFHVYVMSNRTRVLYIGVTNNLERRVLQHQSRATPGFSSRYHLNRLVYFEHYDDATTAIAREKQLKGWRRDRKVALIESFNPKWSDLSRDLDQT